MFKDYLGQDIKIGSNVVVKVGNGPFYKGKVSKLTKNMFHVYHEASQSQKLVSPYNVIVIDKILKND